MYIFIEVEFKMDYRQNRNVFLLLKVSRQLNVCDKTSSRSLNFSCDAKFYLLGSGYYQ